MKNTLKGFLSGVLVTVICISLLGTASATRGKRTAELDYLDIRVTLDDQEIKFDELPGAYVEPFTIDGSTYLPVRAIACALGLGVGWDEATSTVKLTTKDYRPQKDGFDPATNQKLQMEEYIFSIPDYWAGGKDGAAINYYTELGGDKFAVLRIEKSDTEISYEELEPMGESLGKSMEKTHSEDNYVMTDYEMFQGGDGAKGLLYTYSMDIPIEGKKIPGTAKMFVYPSETDHKLIFIIMINSSNTEYIYDNDFTKIPLTIKKNTDSQGTWIGGKPTSPTTQNTEKPKESSQPRPAAPDMPSGSNTVYITKTGKRYHYDSTCNGGNYFSTSLQDAIRRGLTPCQKCVD